jgi:serine/threonine protein kinase/uncharacterized membrane protein
MIDRSGQQLGNYRVLRPVGRGGFADVYLGEHVYLRTQVAIKVLQAKVAGEDDLESFLQEARTIAHLVHPHIVRVMDFGVDDQTPFLVMDYAPNGTLRQRHPKGERLSLFTITQYVKQIAGALQHAHDEKLIHRDIKPENMLLAKNGDVLLGDFGIALIAQSSRYQSTQDVIGTVAYMSPEQIQGRPRAASDQYSLGIVIYEWLSGDRPFRGSFTELCTQHMFASPPSLREKVPTIVPAVEQVVMTALAKDPKQRFGNIRAFANALEQASRSSEATILAPGLASSPLASTPIEARESEPPPESIQAKKPVLPPTQAAPPAQVPIAPSIAPPPQKDAAHALHKDAAELPGIALSSMEPGEQAKRDAKVNVWGFDRRQLIALLVGTVIYGIANYLLDIVLLSNAANSPLFLQVNLSTILFALTLVIPAFFAAKFGPWVGLVSIVVGALTGDVISHAGYSWYIYVALGLFGFLAGLAYLRTRGRYNTGDAIALAFFTSSTGLLCAILLLVTGDTVRLNLNWSSTFSLYFPLLITSIIAMVLLVVALNVYNSVEKRKVRTV